jgi:hypothetical protein
MGRNDLRIAALVNDDVLAAPLVMQHIANLIASAQVRSALIMSERGTSIRIAWPAGCTMPNACSSARTAWLISRRDALSGDTMMVFSGCAA